MTDRYQSYGQGQGGNLAQNSGQNFSQKAQGMESSMNGNSGQHGNGYQQQAHEQFSDNQGSNEHATYGNQGQGYQQSGMNGNQSNQGMNGEPGKAGTSYPDSKAPDSLHVWLDRLEKKFGGDRFDETKHPENAAKNKALNENIILKLKQVMKMAMQRGPALAQQAMSRFM